MFPQNLPKARRRRAYLISEGEGLVEKGIKNIHPKTQSNASESPKRDTLRERKNVLSSAIKYWVVDVFYFTHKSHLLKNIIFVL